MNKNRNKNEEEPKEISKLLKHSLPPMNAELGSDLWPRMQRRLEEGAKPEPWFSAVFSPVAWSLIPWFDWALLAVVVLGICFFPSSIPICLYHL